MNKIEFYTFENEVRYRTSDGYDGKLTESNTSIVKYIIESLEEFHTKAFIELDSIYKKRLPNVPFYRLGMAEHFARCNFGNIDNVSDINIDGTLNLEHVACPLRGICKHENIICNPEFNSKISAAENRVLRLVCQSLSDSEIADELCLSIYTVRNHKRNAYTRLGLRRTSDLIEYARKNNLFKD